MSKSQNSGIKMGKVDPRIFELTEHGQRQGRGRGTFSRFGHLLAKRECVFREEEFHAMLTLERRRAERSRRPFVLMLVDSHAVDKNLAEADFIERLTSVVSRETRETDIIGWYDDGVMLAAILKESSSELELQVTDGV